MKRAKWSNISSAFKAAQAAGSLRIEGIKVSKRDVEMMKGIIDGRVNGDLLKEQLITHFLAENKNTIALASAR